VIPQPSPLAGEGARRRREGEGACGAYIPKRPSGCMRHPRIHGFLQRLRGFLRRVDEPTEEPMRDST